MVAVYQDISVEQGGTFTFVVEVRDSGGVDPRTDLAGWVGFLEVYSKRDPAATLLASAVVDVEAATGIVTATIPNDETAVMSWSSGQYDFWITNAAGTDSEPLAWGTARFRRTVIT